MRHTLQVTDCTGYVQVGGGAGGRPRITDNTTEEKRGVNVGRTRITHSVQPKQCMGYVEVGGRGGGARRTANTTKEMARVTYENDTRTQCS